MRATQNKTTAKKHKQGGEGMEEIGNSAKVISVIKTTSTRGKGTSADPGRIVTQYWTFDGKLLFELDPKMFIDQKAS